MRLRRSRRSSPIRRSADLRFRRSAAVAPPIPANKAHERFADDAGLFRAQVRNKMLLDGGAVGRPALFPSAQAFRSEARISYAPIGSAGFAAQIAFRFH